MPRFDLVGEPASLTEVGGTDLDAIVFSLVEGAIGDVTSSVGHDDHTGMVALRRVRASCRAAKERLSTEQTAVVEVALPHARGRVEITREAFELAAAPALADAVGLLLSTIEDAGLIPADVSCVLLTGGSANIPRLAELVSERTGMAVVVDADPDLTVAQGAALFGDIAGELPGPVTGAHPAVAAGVMGATGSLVADAAPTAAAGPMAADATSVFGDPIPAPGPVGDLVAPPPGPPSIFGDLPGDPIPAPGPFADLAAPPTGDLPAFDGHPGFGDPPGAPTTGAPAIRPRHRLRRPPRLR